MAPMGDTGPVPRPHLAWMRCWLLGAALVFPAARLFAAEAAVPPEPPSAAVLAFDRFIAASSPVCSFEPSGHCVDMGWHFADTNRDGYLEPSEVKAVRAEVQDWLTWKGGDLTGPQRTGVTLGLIVIDSIGLDNIFAGLNTAGSGKLSRAELLTDVKLDDRPLGKVLQDPNSVDRKDLAHRLGKFSAVVNGMLDEGKPKANQ
jgi:hypothetical protein